MKSDDLPSPPPPPPSISPTAGSRRLRFASLPELLKTISYHRLREGRKEGGGGGICGAGKEKEREEGEERHSSLLTPSLPIWRGARNKVPCLSARADQ